VTGSGDEPHRPLAGDEIPVREARLRPEFAERYPGMRAGMWYLAATVASAVRHDETEPPEDMRALPDAHFDFRGGAPERRHNAQTRSSDRTRDLPT
jgi:hypothetical protein